MKRFAIGLIVAALALPGFFGCDSGQVTTGKIASEPDQFYGKTVDVKAEVEHAYGAHAFTLDEDAALAGPDVLVIVPRPAGTVEEDVTVSVRGEVRPLVVTELERDYDWFDADSYQPDLLVRFKERPVIIAQSIRTEDGKELIGTEAHAAAGAEQQIPPE